MNPWVKSAFFIYIKIKVEGGRALCMLISRGCFPSYIWHAWQNLWNVKIQRSVEKRRKMAGKSAEVLSCWSKGIRLFPCIMWGAKS